MSRITTNDIETGMILSSDVKDRGGRALLKAGLELTEKHLKIFKTWGITHIEIEGDETTTSLQTIINAHPELEAAAQQAAEDQFRHTDPDHPFFKELNALWIQRHIKVLAAAI
jgi:hypothetical protein